VIVLGVDASSPSAGVGLLDTEGRNFRRDLGTPGDHAERIVGAALEILGEAGIGWNDVALLAVGVGPGSFTGVRVGVAWALGAAEARGIPVTGCGSLDILARACYDATLPGTGTYIVPVADVRRGEVVVARFRTTDRGPVRESEDTLAALGDPGPPPPAGTILAGDGGALPWSGYRVWRSTGGERALAAARIGAAAQAEGMIEVPVPRYARPADARPRRGGA
jgi:tRNA threonylcarbamoyladenosine biosynthesis protein TsaB